VGSRVEQFEQIRRDREVEGLSIRALAERHGVHRRAVRQALACAIPPPKRRPEGRPAPALGPYHALIDEWLTADREAPRKQRHTARRIWQRLVEEHGAEVAEVTVRQHVRARRRAIGLAGEAYVPQIHHPGAEAEVDWGEASVIMRSVPIQIGLFYLRACHSGASFVGAFPRMTQQAFLEGHAEAFEHFGGVFSLIRYDNLTSAVKLVLRGRRRVESDRFTAMRSHYRFESQFTLVGIAGAHEKGGVEGEVGRYRRRHLVPVPEVGALQGSLALAQERERGAWPSALDELWAQIAARYGDSEAARHMVEVLLLAREVGPERMIAAAAGALAAGAHDGRAVALLARRASRAPVPVITDLPERLARLERPTPGLSDYDQLLEGGGR